MIQPDYIEASLLDLALRSDYAAEVFDTVKPEHFSSDMQPAIASAYALFMEGKPLDLLTVAEHMEAQGVERALDLITRIVEASGQASIANLAYYAKIVASRGLRRQLEYALLECRSLLNDETPEAAHQKIIQRFADLDQSDDDSLWDMKTAAKAFLEEMQRRCDANGELIGLSTGFSHLDNRIGGMRPGDSVIIAGRPGMGKSTLALNIVEHNALRQKIPTLIFSLEMSAPQVIEKITSSYGAVDLGGMRRGVLKGEEWSRFSAAAQAVQNAPLRIDDRGGLSVAQVRARCFEVKRRHGLELVVIDYMGLMTATGSNLNEQITKISKGIKQLAKDLKCPVISLSQLNRGVEQRVDKRPGMADLRESGAIEQDADVIIFPYREGYYDKDSTSPDPTVEVIFGKIRMGEPGSEGLEWQGRYSRFVSMEARPDFQLIRAQATQANAPPAPHPGRRKSGGFNA